LDALPITGFVFAQRFTRRSQRGWAAYSAISGFAMFTVFFFARLSLRPGFEEMAGLFGLFQRITVTIGWAWLNPARRLHAQGSIGHTNKGKKVA
jgi:hypothetical protein